jgi:hypothetical protein
MLQKFADKEEADLYLIFMDWLAVTPVTFAVCTPDTPLLAASMEILSFISAEPVIELSRNKPRRVSLVLPVAFCIKEAPKVTL